LEGWYKRSPLTQCSTEGCRTLVAGDTMCSRCREEVEGTPYPLATLLLDSTHRALTVAILATLTVIAGVSVALAIIHLWR
jgi:hypothetical protein